MFRRCWGLAEGWLTGEGPNKAVQIGYQGYNTIAENLMIAWDLMPASDDSQSRGNLCIARISAYPEDDQNCGFYGCITYNLNEHERVPPFFGESFSANGLYDVGNNRFRDIVMYAEKVLSSDPYVALRLQEQSVQSVAQDMTYIGPSTTDSFHGTWTVTNYEKHLSVAAANAAGSGHQRWTRRPDPGSAYGRFG